MLNDIIRKYQLTFSIIKASPNPKTQLKAIINFFKLCEHHDFHHLYKYFIKDFIHCIYNIFKHSAVDFLDPYYLYASKYILRKSLDIEKDRIAVNEINSAIELINFQLLILLYHLGEIENGKLILLDLIKSKNIFTDRKDENSKKNKISDSKSLVDPALFHINKAFDILKRIDYEISIVNSASENSVNILLVESDNAKLSMKNNGMIQELSCIISENPKNTQNNFFLENIIDIHEEGFEELKNPLIDSANILLRQFKESLNSFESKISMRFTDTKGIYKGKSFGAGASLLLCTAYLKYIDKRIKLSIACNTAFTGNISSNGELLPLPESSIETKVEAAFFSWIKNVVLPIDNLQSAKKILNGLQKKYRKKELNLFGVKNISELLGYKNIVQIKEETRIQHTIRTIQKHKNLSYTTLIILLITLTAFSVYKFIPRNIKPPPSKSDYSRMTYTPDRDTVWHFANIDKAGGDTIRFGETAIGDQWQIIMSLFNNSYSKEPLAIDVEGKDKDEFEVIWYDDAVQTESPEYTINDVNQKMYLKFIPFKSTGDKEAQLIFYNKSNPEYRKILYLKGISDIYKNGYSLKMSDDDILTINPKGNVLKNEFAFSFWFKVNERINIITDGTPSWSQTKFCVYISPDSTLELTIISSLISPTNHARIKTKSKIRFNEWDFAAISHINNKTYLILNDEVVEYKTEDNHLLQFEDYLYFGDIHPVQMLTYGYRKDSWELKLSEFRLYNKFINPKEILSKKHLREYPYNKNLLCYYDFDEGNGKNIHDKTINDLYGIIYGLPQRSLDIPNLVSEKKESIVQKDKDYCIQTKGKGQVVLNKSLFKHKSSFSLVMDVKFDTKLLENINDLFKIDNGVRRSYNATVQYDSVIYISHSIIDGSTSANGTKIVYKAWNRWNRIIYDYSLEQNKGRIFIDGILLSEYSFGNLPYDISKTFFSIYFAGDGSHDNPRFLMGEKSVDNIAVFNRILNDDEVKFKTFNQFKNLQGLLAFWTFDKIENNICYDELYRIPVFLWDDFEVLVRK
ncbi:MAG: hypothetical protein WC644_08675 [Ignavibacteria bacterium]